MVCIKHFLEKDVTKSNTLKKGAIPSIFNPSNPIDSIPSITSDGVQAAEKIQEEIRCSTEMSGTFDPSDPIDSIPSIASDGVQAAANTQAEIRCSTEISETFDPSDPIDSIPFIASDGVQAAEKTQEKIRSENDNLIERTNATIQVYKLEDKIKSLKATIEKQSAHIKRLNREMSQRDKKNQMCLQQNLLEKAAMNAISEVRYVSNFVEFNLEKRH